MSYIVAHVKFSPTGNAYPVECFRADLQVGDQVIVQLPNRPLVAAVVDQIAYLNWKCTGRIKCKISEAIRSPEGHWILPKGIGPVGLVSADALISELKKLGWIHLRPSHIHRFALTHTNESETANILLRSNGVDLQILPYKRIRPFRPYSIEQEGVTVGRVVRHFLSHTTFNLYESVLQFAHCFIENTGNYDPFFSSVGSRDKRSEQLKRVSDERMRARIENESNPLREYYDEMSDESGEDVYLGDGMWVGPGGGIFDKDGR